MIKIQEQQRVPTSFVVVSLLFFGLLILVSFEAIRFVYMNSLVLIFFIFWVLYDYATLVDFDLPGVKKNKNFLALDGSEATCVTTLQPEYGGKMSIVVAAKPAYVPEQFKMRLGGMKGFLAFMAGRIHFRIEDDAWKFVDLKEPYLNAPEGAIIYLGSLDKNRPVQLLDKTLLDQLEYKDAIARKMNTLVAKATSQMAVDSKDQAESYKEALMGLVPLLSELMRTKEQNIPRDRYMEG